MVDLRDILRGAGHSVVGHAANEAEALKLAKRGKPYQPTDVLQALLTFDS